MRPTATRLPRPTILLCLLAGLLPGRAQAQDATPPSLPDSRLYWVFPAGGQRGTTFEVTVNGFDLDEATELRFDDPGITGTPKLVEPGLGQSGPQPAPNVFTVTIKPDVRPGTYDVRVLGRYGISTPRSFVVGTQPEINEAEPNNSLPQAVEVPLGTLVNGTIQEAKTDYYKISVKAGQRVIVDCLSFRIDSHSDPTLVLYDSTGRELDRNRNTNRRDPLIDFTARQDGQYIVGIYDEFYNYYVYPGESFYRLSFSTGPYLDYIFPSAGLSGTNGSYTLYGRNLPGGQPAGELLGGKRLEKLTVNIPLPADSTQRLGGDLLAEPSEAFVDGIEYRLESPQVSNSLFVGFAAAPVVAEQEPNDDPARAPLVQWPCEIAGQLYPRGDQDWLTFDAKKGDTLWIEVHSQRMGLVTDPYLLVQQLKKDEQGHVQAVDLQTADDRDESASDFHWSLLVWILFSNATQDPACKFVAPEDGTYRVLLKDQARAAEPSPRFVYRLSIRPPQPDYRLVAIPRPPTATIINMAQKTAWSPLLRSGGAELIEVFAVRREGFDGEIRLTAESLPAGVSAAPVVIGPGVRSTTMIFKAAEGAPASVTPIAITGKARIGNAEVSRTARTGSMLWPSFFMGLVRSRMTHQLPLAVVANEAAPLSLDVAPDLVLEASRLGTLKFPLSVVRRGDFKGSIALSSFGLPLIPGVPVHAHMKYDANNEIKADQNSTEFTINLANAQIPTGTYSFFISGAGTVNYARNPAALKAALDRKAAIEKIVADDAAAAKTALDAQASAEQQRLAATADQLAAATQAKAVADTAAATADAKAKQSAAALQTFSQELTKLQEKSKAADILISSPSAPITIKITAGPLAFEPATPAITIKQGTKLDVAVPIKRLYGYADAVQLALVPPGGVLTGFSIPRATVPAGQNQGTLTVDLGPNTPPGKYDFKLVATVAYNGQNLTVEQEIPVTIEK